MEDVMPLVLRYCYANQDWSAIEPDIEGLEKGIFAAATMLKSERGV
jgi:hypothetical protein